MRNLIYGRNINEKFVSSRIESLVSAGEVRGRVKHLRLLLSKQNLPRIYNVSP